MVGDDSVRRRYGSTRTWERDGEYRQGDLEVPPVVRGRFHPLSTPPPQDPGDFGNKEVTSYSICWEISSTYPKEVVCRRSPRSHSPRVLRPEVDPFS